MMTHKQLKQKALSNASVKKEYDDLSLEFSLLNQMLSARKNIGLSQTEVAERMGTKQTAITRLESSLASGKLSPSLATINKYANAVDCDIDIKFIQR
ncbi:XRE family transcriptional regulator [Isorropodon fossajaponicum endosymbiont JTNG4]|uniref:helix-turn-helix domain-containing protein n=1 Tax=Isorropodon fossajaponicum symbiont TaxID=883811 RepID=UPI0019358A8F|nr:XRE family transcriptional regulator [Isorropodon fossajaponicum endosymbiont JTNG4]